MIRHLLSFTNRLLLLIVFSAWILPGCSATSAANEEVDRSTSGEVQEAPHDTTDHEGKDLEALYWERVEQGRQSFTQADVDFMIGMIAHHAQALIMSELAFVNEANEEIQRLARRIHSAQEGEIAVMQQWLNDRGQPVPRVHIEGIHLMIHGLDDTESEHEMHHHQQDPEDDPDSELHDHDSDRHHMHMDHSDMPGMLTQEQLEEMEEARGRLFDRLFLEYMIEHHIGAVIMVNELFATDGAAQDPDIFRLASDINSDQIIEINRMREMLERL